MNERMMTRPTTGRTGGIKTMQLRTATKPNGRFDQWVKALTGQGYRYMAFDGTKFILSPTPIPPAARRDGPYSRITPDTTPSLVRNILLQRQQRVDRAGFDESYHRVERLIAQAEQA